MGLQGIENPNKNWFRQTVNQKIIRANPFGEINLREVLTDLLGLNHFNVSFTKK